MSSGEQKREDEVEEGISELRPGCTVVRRRHVSQTTRLQTWFPFPTGLTSGGEPLLDPVQKFSQVEGVG